MDFYDVVDKAKKSFDTACKATETAINTSKQRLDQVALESKLSKSYEILGKYCYDAFMHGTTVDKEAVEPITDDITEKIEQIELLKKEILKAKNKKTCAECGAEVNKTALFCSKCGAKIG